MRAFTLNIKGQLNNMRLSESKALWPLFEAVVNSIQAIEESENKDNGKISIYAKREKSVQQELTQKESLERFESFVITDNGVGMNDENYKSFNTAYSTLKLHKGCKGIGRFLWLKAFNSVKIESVFLKEQKYYLRKFTFSPDGIEPDDNIENTDESETKTIVTLDGFMHQYKNVAPVELDVIAKKIIEHCLPFFISGKCPEIKIFDGISDSINLNTYFDVNIKDSLHQDLFTIKDNEFILYHLRLPEGASSHEIHFCANMQEVNSIDLKNYIPDLQKKVIPVDNPIGFFYVGYISSSYLDSIVNTTRTNFEYDESGSQISLFGTSKDTILSTAIDFVKAYLSDYLSDINRKKHQIIDEFVSYDKPTYRFLLKQRPQVYEAIPAGLKPDALEMELHKHVQEWELEIKQNGKELEKIIKENANSSDATYHDLFEKYWTGITDISKTCLAEYVTRRKTILTILENVLTIQDKGRFSKEDAIHSIICPMRHTSNDIAFEEMNLWLVDERLAYHRYLASDKTLKSMPVIDSNSTKEPDIAIFDQAFVYSDSDEPFSSITIIEFKKPDNDNKNPINQVLEYIDLIRDGKKKKSNGQSFNVTDGTIFRCYVICDLTNKMRTHCLNSSILPTADNVGYSGFNQGRHAYIEVISYNKLLSDAKKRNSILFEKLFSPDVTKILHIPKND
ncbi:MAG: hypothetical protein Q8873_05245 [Bacillota bacterium]|nr:hypothetical protein [Bacillota bacterium]